MIDILIKAIKNRFRILMYIYNLYNSEQEKKNFFKLSILLDDFLFFPEKNDMVSILNCLNDIQINENIRYHTSIIKLDIDTFYNTFSKQNYSDNLKYIKLISTDLL